MEIATALPVRRRRAACESPSYLQFSSPSSALEALPNSLSLAASDLSSGHSRRRDEMCGELMSGPGLQLLCLIRRCLAKWKLRPVSTRRVLTNWDAATLNMDCARCAGQQKRGTPVPWQLLRKYAWVFVGNCSIKISLTTLVRTRHSVSTTCN